MYCVPVWVFKQARIDKISQPWRNFLACMQELVSQFRCMGTASVMHVKEVEHVGKTQHRCQCLDLGKAPLIEPGFVVPADRVGITLFVVG